MSNRREKRNGILGSLATVQHAWDTFDLVAFNSKVTLGSFGALAILPKIRFSNAPFFLQKMLPMTVHTKFIIWHLTVKTTLKINNVSNNNNNS